MMILGREFRFRYGWWTPVVCFFRGHRLSFAHPVTKKRWCIRCLRYI